MVRIRLSSSALRKWLRSTSGISGATTERRYSGRSAGSFFPGTSTRHLGGGEGGERGSRVNGWMRDEGGSREGERKRRGSEERKEKEVEKTTNSEAE